MFIGGALDERARLNIAKLGLGLALELRLGKTDADDRREALPDVLTLKVVFVVLDQVPLLGVTVHHRGQGTAEALLVHPPLQGVDPVGKRVKAVGVEAGIPLEGDLNLLTLFDPLDITHFGEKRFLGSIHVGNKIPNTPLVPVFHLVMVPVRSLVAESDLEAPVQKGHHLEPLGQGLKSEAGLIEDRPIGPEAHGGPGPTVR